MLNTVLQIAEEYEAVEKSKAASAALEAEEASSDENSPPLRQSKAAMPRQWGPTNVSSTATCKGWMMLHKASGIGCPM